MEIEQEKEWRAVKIDREEYSHDKLDELKQGCPPSFAIFEFCFVARIRKYILMLFGSFS